jgi:hypothetical protein
MIIDAHMVIGPYHPVMPPSEIDDLLAYMERSGLDQMVTMNHTGWPVSRDGCATVNRDLAATIKLAPKHIVGVAWIDPTMGTPMFDCTASASRSTASPGAGSG